MLTPNPCPGAGAAGSSTAYHLHKYAQDDAPDTAVNITIFEKTDRIGGRTLTVNPHGQAQESIELGASIFIQINAILYNATQEFGLETTSFSDAGGVMSIWDGDKFVLEIDQTLPTWRVVLKILWKYGIRGPVNANNLMKATIAKFLKLYEKPFFPFKSLSERAFDLDLLEATGVTGKEYLEKNNVSSSGNSLPFYSPLISLLYMVPHARTTKQWLKLPLTIYGIGG